MLLVAVTIWVANSALNAGLGVYETHPLSRHLPLTSMAQGVKVTMVLLGVMIVLSAIFHVPLVSFLAVLAAFGTVLSFVFRDPILGFLPGIQLAAFDMVQIGDWIEMRERGVDGDLVEVNLTTVKVGNWDKSISTVPTYDLIGHSFTNWGAMEAVGGRRLVPSLHMDASTITACTPDMIASLPYSDAVKEYLDRPGPDAGGQAQVQDSDGTRADPVGGFTNIGLFRAYLLGYLRAHPMIRADLLTTVRLREPTEHGLPVEIYAFFRRTDHAGYWEVQSEILEHALLMARTVGLKVFQYPAGSDVGTLLSEDPRRSG